MKFKILSALRKQRRISSYMREPKKHNLFDTNTCKQHIRQLRTHY